MGYKKNLNQQLLVEGNDDKHVIWALCEKFAIVQNFEVIDCKGINLLQEQITVRLKQSDIRTIGIIVDADADLQKRWNSISSIISEQGFHCPPEIPSEGFIVLKGEIKIGIWIMPNNNTTGMLEDFISFLVPVDDKLFLRSNATLSQMEQENINRYSLTHKSKALIHTWLAWQSDPGTPMGLAITKKYLTNTEENCSVFIKWINDTFN